VNDDYVAGHVEEALAQTGETDVHVRVDGGALLVTGTVATRERHDAVVAIASRMTELTVRDEVTVLHCEEPTTREELA
jgi:hypothetical protein